nr:putative leucine-rich repeat protein, plant-type [Tanacetum cinerariifolium]
GDTILLLSDALSFVVEASWSWKVHLDLSLNSLVLELDFEWSPNFLLEVISLSSCKLGPSFPTWLQTQKNFSIIDISNTQIDDPVPDWFWKQLTPNLRYLNVSFNKIQGSVPDLMYGDQSYIDLSSNNFLGPVPWFPSNTQTLVLSNNMFSGSISFVCNFTTIGKLDLSKNQFLVELPNCWMNLTRLFYLNLESNNFSGVIPSSIGFLSYIGMLSMRNSLTGELPSSLQSCTLLQLLDVGENNLYGLIPVWIRKCLTELCVLSLPSNGFNDTLPPSLCKLSKIKILDISINSIFGTIPKCLSNLKGMTKRVTEVMFFGVNTVGLERRIPTSTQLQSFGASSYNGNTALFGLPLPNICTEDIIPQNPQTTLGTNVAGDQDRLITQGFFISLSIRLVFGFWGVCGALVVNDAWRYAYYEFMNHKLGRICNGFVDRVFVEEGAALLQIDKVLVVSTIVFIVGVIKEEERLWRIKMRALLIQHGCEAALEVLPADMKAQAKAELNKKGRSVMILCLGNKVLREATGETTAARVWSKLETLYMTKSLANKLYLEKKLYTFYMLAGRKIFEHIDEFNKIVLDLANIEVKFEDEDLALLLLTFLPASYKYFVDTLLNRWEALILEDVMAILNSKKIKERSKAKGDDGEGLYVRGRTNRKDSRQSRAKSKSKSRGERLKCYIFLFENHFKRNCLNNNHKKSTGYVKKDKQPSSSGSAYDNSELGDNSECKIRGIGKVRIVLRDGSSFVSHNVRYIPELKRKLISLGILEKEGFTVKLQSGKVKVWHKRLGHISKVGLQVLEKQGMFGKKSQGKLDFCENCVLGKSHQARFGVGRHTTQELIYYVHSDLWGPSQVESLGGHWYLLSIVDDYSRRVWVYILMFKHVAFRKFKKWKQLVENQTRRTVKKLRTNNGTLFIETFWAEATCTAAYLINRSPSTAIEKKTPMKIWSGHLSDYGMLRIFGCVAYLHDKQGKVEPRAIKCVLLGYPEGVKGYRLYRLDDESPKIVTSRNVVFNESVMYKDTLNDSGADADKSEDGDDEDAGDQETDQIPYLTDYQLAQDRERRTRTKPLRFQDEKMDSLRKNKTWELVDHPAGQNLVSYKWMFMIKEGIEGVQKPRSYAPGEYIYLLLYIDDMLIACKRNAEIGSTKSLLKKEFNMKGSEKQRRFLINLGLRHLRYTHRGLYLHNSTISHLEADQFTALHLKDVLEAKMVKVLKVGEVIMAPTTRITASSSNSDDGSQESTLMMLWSANVRWSEYKDAIIQRFRSVFEDPMDALKNAKYDKNAKEYHDLFDVGSYGSRSSLNTTRNV